MTEAGGSMADAGAGNGCRLGPAIRGRLPHRRGDSGLTTLEWLLIVAAVAGLAALAVVVVQNVVSDTSEQIAGQTARRTAAELSAQDITNDARDDVADVAAITPEAAERINDEFEPKCDRLEIIYSDVVGLEANWTDATESGGSWDTQPECTVN